MSALAKPEGEPEQQGKPALSLGVLEDQAGFILRIAQ